MGDLNLVQLATVLAVVGSCLAVVLVAFLVRRTAPPVGADAEIARFLSEYMPTAAERDRFSGVVFVARGDDVLFHRAYGLANRQDSVPNTTSTRFNLASTSKVFTAVAVAKLMEEERLSYDDPIGKHLGSDWISADVGRRVLVRHLLNHTSGLGMYWGEKWDQFASQIRTVQDFRLAVTDALAFEPGTRYQYSNTGYVLLGAIIERVTGETYYDFVQRTIFTPCGMKSTGFYPTNRAVEGCAIGYFEDKEDGGKLKDNLSLHGSIGSPAGGGWSTATDLHRFFLAMDRDQIVAAPSRKILWTPKPPAAETGFGFADYGYGFQIGAGVVGHLGGFPGVEAFVYHFPAFERTFVALSNLYDSVLPLMDEMPRRLGLLGGDAKTE